MKPANIPENETERLKVLKTYNLLDTLPDEDYDAITKIAAAICNTPIALISIIDEDRQWFKSRHGLNRIETPRDFAFCSHSILKPNELFIVKDATKDHRFHDNPLITSDPNLVFYAGAPLNSQEGYPLGTLCVIDNKPNDLNENQKESLKLLSKQVTYLFELRKKNQKLMKANEEVFRLNKQLSEFAYRLSHDIKTPISGIKFLSEIIQEDYAEQLDKKGINLLHLMSSRSAYLYSIVEGMLNFTNVTNIEIVYETFHLKELLEQVKSSCNWENTCEIKYTNCEISVKQSKIAFIQIFQNLVSNSIKHTDLEQPIISISLEIESDFYKIIYKDNGPGIEEKYKEKVFQLFETLGKENSTGIGLSTVNSILERLGGSIDIKSLKEKNSGVEFYIKFPILKD
jgi:signal transduction histidine kinase